MADVRAALTRHELPLRRPLATTRGPITARTVWLLRLTDTAGRCGWGEAAPLPGFGGEEPRECADALARFAADPGDPTAWPGPTTPCARHAADWAQRDLAARAAGLPLATLLGGRPGRLPVSALAADADEAAQAALAGCTVVKIKAESDPLATARRLQAVQAAVGGGVRLRLDVNGAWDEAGTRAFLAATDVRLDHLEQPLPADAWAGHTRLHDLVPIALDESLRSLAEVERAGRERAAAVAVLKPMFLGGWNELLAAVAAARRYHLGVVLSSALDGAVGRAAALHAGLALGLAGTAHGLATGDWLATDLGPSPHVVDHGALRADDAPGLGLVPA